MNSKQKLDVMSEVAYASGVLSGLASENMVPDCLRDVAKKAEQKLLAALETLKNEDAP